MDKEGQCCAATNIREKEVSSQNGATDLVVKKGGKKAPDRKQEKEVDETQSPLSRLMTRTGCSIVQQNGQRRYGPPPTWQSSPPKRGSEIFVGKIPRDCFEDELVPVFEKAGPVYEMRLMMDYNGLNRGYAFVVYCNLSDAKESVKLLNNYEIRKGRTLGVCISVDNCRLFVGGIPKKVNKDEIKEEMEKVTEGVVNVIVYPSASDKTKNRGFAFVEYQCHRAAAMARRKLMNGRVHLWNHPIAVDWAEPEMEVAEEIMSQVKVLYVRNLMLSTSEAKILEEFSAFAPVERVKKIRDYAFVHFVSRLGAITTMKALNGALLDGAKIEVTLAKPVDKESQQRNQKVQQPLSSFAAPFGFLPVDYFQALYPGYYPSTPKYVPRNSMGAKVIRSPRNSKGKSPGGYYSVGFASQLMIPASPVHGHFVSPFIESPKHTQRSDDSVYEVISGLEMSPVPPHQTPPSPHTTPPHNLSLKPPRNPSQTLEEICLKNNWGQPLYHCHTISTTSDGQQLLQYKVFVPALGTTYIPSKFCFSIEESHCAAAEYALIQLGFPTSEESYLQKVPHVGFSPAQVSPLTAPPSTGGDVASTLAVPYSPHNFLAVPNPQKHLPAPPSWSPEHNLYGGYDPPGPPGYIHPLPDIYHQPIQRNF